MFDRKSQFDRSFFDRTVSLGAPLPARIAGLFTIVTRNAEKITTNTRASDKATIITRPGNFAVVAYK